MVHQRASKGRQSTDTGVYLTTVQILEQRVNIESRDSNVNTLVRLKEISWRDTDSVRKAWQSVNIMDASAHDIRTGTVHSCKRE